MTPSYLREPSAAELKAREIAANLVIAAKAEEPIVLPRLFSNQEAIDNARQAQALAEMARAGLTPTKP